MTKPKSDVPACSHVWATHDEIGRPYCAVCGEPWAKIRAHEGVQIAAGNSYFNSRGDWLGPMDERTPGVFLDQFGRLYHPDGKQWDHAPGSTGNIVRRTVALGTH